MRAQRTLFVLVLGLVLISGPAAPAAVTFFFDYSDPSNTTDFGSGAFFDGSPMGMARKLALSSTAAEMGGLLDHTTAVKIYVKTIFSPSGPLASGGAAYYPPPTASGVIPSAMQSSIIMGVPLPPTDYHGTLIWNAAKPFYTGAAPVVSPPGFFDFRSVAWHEMTHILGWQSALVPGSGGYTSSLTDSLIAFDPVKYAGLGEVFPIYDTFLIDSESDPALLGGAVNPAFSHVAGVKVAGPNLLALSEAVSTDTTPFPPHYDTTHLADSVFSIMHGSLGPDTVRRGWTDVDIAIIKDLGYSIVVPEPSTLGLLALAGLALLRRRSFLTSDL